jgi:enoyl-CoA hydratase
VAEALRIFGGMSNALVMTERRDGVLICHLDDGKANALSSDMIVAITAAIDEAEADADVHAVVLHGREGKFSAGFDLSVMLADDVPAITALVADGGELVRKIYSARIPVVAACTGHALAAGALILLGCDVRIGSDRPCKIGLNEVAIGMTLPDWALTIAGERLSKRHLQRAIPTARITDAVGAVDAGYLDEVVADADVLDAAVAQAAEFAGLSAKAYAVTVRKMRGDTAAKMAEEIAADRAGGIGAPL